MSAASLFCYSSPPSTWFTPAFLSSFVGTLVPSLLVNLYITGLNQIIDIDIDRINKPFLPIAAGTLSPSSAKVLILSSLLGAYLLTLNAHPPLRLTLFLSSLIGTIYSLPPFRLKQFPLFAAICILVVRGAFVNVGFYTQVSKGIRHALP